MKKEALDAIRYLLYQQLLLASKYPIKNVAYFENILLFIVIYWQPFFPIATLKLLRTDPSLTNGYSYVHAVIRTSWMLNNLLNIKRLPNFRAILRRPTISMLVPRQTGSTADGPHVSGRTDVMILFIAQYTTLNLVSLTVHSRECAAVCHVSNRCLVAQHS